MFLPFLLLIHGILAVSLSHSHLPFLHEFIHRIVLIVLFPIPSSAPKTSGSVCPANWQQTFCIQCDCTALHCTCYHCSCLSVLVRSRGSRVQDLCENRGGHPELPVPNSPYSDCGRKTTLENRAQELCESRGGRPGLPVPNTCLLYTSPSPRDRHRSRMPSSA